MNINTITTVSHFHLYKIGKINFKKNSKLAIWKEFIVMRFRQKIDLRTISIVQKLRAVEVLFALMLRIQNNIFLDFL